MKERRRIFAVLLSLLMICLPAVARAGTFTQCSFDEASALVSVAVEGTATVGRLGDSITVDGTVCADATVENADRITVDATAASSITIDLSHGPLAPGLTDEGDGTSEIETEIQGGTDIAVEVIGSDGDDALALSRIFDGGVMDAIDLDASGPDLDVDVTLHGDDAASIAIDAGAGDDRIDATGSPYGVPYIGASTLQGGAGRDAFIFAGALETTEPAFLGGQGRDALDISTAPADEQASVDLVFGVAIVGGTSVEVVNSIEHVVGHPGSDFLVGTVGRQTLQGLGGNDIIEGRAGDDRLIGGPGRDELRGGEGTDTCRGGPGKDSLSRCER